VRNLPFPARELRLSSALKESNWEAVPVPRGPLSLRIASPIMGPVDGQRLAEMSVRTSRAAHRVYGPDMVHVVTNIREGLPLRPRPTSVGLSRPSAFDHQTGKASVEKPKPPSYSKCSADLVKHSAEHGPTVVGSRPDVPPALARPIEKALPSLVFDVGNRSSMP